MRTFTLKLLNFLMAICMFIGAISLLGIIAAIGMALFGETQFPVLSEPVGSFGTYLWQVGAMVLGAFIVWRVLLAIGLRIVPWAIVENGKLVEVDWDHA